MLIPMRQGQFCAQCKTQTRYALEVVQGQFEYRCRDHMPAGLIQEYWTGRMLNAAQEGNFEKAREILKLVLAECRIDAQEVCAKIADVVVSDVARSHSNEDVAHGAATAAQDIARSIRAI